MNYEIMERNLDVDGRAQFIMAKREELTSDFRNVVRQLHYLDPSDNDRVITARWVLTWKEEENKSPRAKARLVLRGYEDPDLAFIEKTIPIATRQSTTIMLVIAGNFAWAIFGGDVKVRQKLRVSIPTQPA